MLKRPEVEEVFIKYATNTVAASGPKMTVSDLMDFFAKEQKNPMASAECHRLIEAFEPMKDKTSLSIEGKFITVTVIQFDKKARGRGDFHQVCYKYCGGVRSENDCPPVYLHSIFEISSVTRIFFNFKISSLEN